MLASVANLDEALLVADEGVDLIDLKDPSQGALGAVTTELALEVVHNLSGSYPLSATIGDIPLKETTQLSEAIDNMTATGVDLIKIGAFGELTDEALAVIKAQAIEGARKTAGFSIVIVWFAEQWPIDFGKISMLAAAGVKGIMLDTADKDSGSLTEKIAVSELRAFIDQAKSYGLLSGLAGSLSVADLPLLLPLQPDYLGFRGALCQGAERTHCINPAVVREIRSIIKFVMEPSSRCPAIGNLI